MERPDWPVLPDDIGEVRLVFAVDAEQAPDGWQARTWPTSAAVSATGTSDGPAEER